MKFKLMMGIMLMVFCFPTGCRNNNDIKNNEHRDPPGLEQKITFREKSAYAVLPDTIQWLTNNSDPVFSSEKAQKGGIFHAAITSFPMTFRVVGPDSNGSFRSAILDNQLSLINIHPNTGRILPELATHWAFGEDKKTMYFKLDKDARWSDGKPVTAWDYAYTLEFMRSEHIIAPWYNDYYTKEIEKVIVYDEYTIGVKSTKAVPELYLKLGIAPTPEHYFGILDDTFVQLYNWAIIPNTGAYQISEFKKGKFIKFKRKKDWWAKDKTHFKNRFNVDYVVFDVIRDTNLQWQYFKKGKLDTFDLTIPKYWHEKSNISLFQNGYIHKIWFFNDHEQSAMGMWLNQDKEIFKDRRLCYAFAHAMNIEKVINNVLRGDYFRLSQAFTGYGEYTDDSIKPRQYDIAKVETLMRSAGWTRGSDGVWQNDETRFSVKVTYGYEEHTPRLVVLKEEALKAGIELLLERLDSTAMFKKFLEKKHDVAWMGWSTNIRPSYWQGWHSDNAHKPQTNNITNTDDHGLDELIDTYRSSLNREERIALSLTIQQAIHETGAFVPTFMVPYVRMGFWRWLELPEFHGTKRSDSLFDPFSVTTGGLFWMNADKKDKTLKALKNDIQFEPVVILDEQFKKE
ncbi:extracellular solute-binding protein [Desulfobacula phenolica]|uniref:Microcin C transport system substrate-binding protein n=1 Tax=Desulfobacula phenolica TaxID=90732 RepID=A0A1H2EU20_9BACT|nr:extracellular solute-binding protein [Desulfobacula phenolica]SDT98600.1 microcin C transport system substrate-binding protein [Desulfobacula phenolica]